MPLIDCVRSQTTVGSFAGTVINLSELKNSVSREQRQAPPSEKREFAGATIYIFYDCLIWNGRKTVIKSRASSKNRVRECLALSV